jgi:hypothetical protein
MAGSMSVDALARVPLSYPTYGAVLARVAAKVARELNARMGPDTMTPENYLPA